MKNFLFLMLLVMISCGNKDENQALQEAETTSLTYDTIAKDSFSNGAISVDIARKIRMSSVQYQDSLKEAAKKIEAEKLLKKEAEEKDKAAKTLEAEKKKTDEAKSEKKKTESEPAPK